MLFPSAIGQKTDSPLLVDPVLPQHLQSVSEGISMLMSSLQLSLHIML